MPIEQGRPTEGRIRGTSPQLVVRFSAQRSIIHAPGQAEPQTNLTGASKPMRGRCETALDYRPSVAVQRVQSASPPIAPAPATIYDCA